MLNNRKKVFSKQRLKPVDHVGRILRGPAARAGALAFLSLFAIVFAIYFLSALCVLISALIAALICSGSSGQTATISARSVGSSEVSISPCFRDLGVNWGVNGIFGILQVFVLAELTLFVQRTLKTMVSDIFYENFVILTKNNIF